MIEKIHAKNTVSIQGLRIQWIEWLFTLAQRKKDSSLVVEFRAVMKANEVKKKGLNIIAKSH